MKKFGKIFVFGLVSIFLFSGMAFSQKGFQMRSADEICRNMQTRLGLTDAQTEAVRPIIQEHREKQKALFEEYRGKGRSARGEMRAKMDELREENRTKLQGVLTQEQMEKYKSWIQDMKNFRNSRGRGGRCLSDT